MDFLSRLTARVRGEVSLLEPLFGSLQPRLAGVGELEAQPEGLVSTSPDRTSPEPVRAGPRVPSGPVDYTLHRSQSPVAELPGPSGAGLPRAGDPSPASPERVSERRSAGPGVEEPATPIGAAAQAAAAAPRTSSPIARIEPFPVLVPVPPASGEPGSVAPVRAATPLMPASPVRAAAPLMPAPPVRAEVAGAPSTPSAAGRGVASATGPVIRVSIGRVEVRAVAPPVPQPRPQPAGRRAVQSLDDYLSQRERGRR